MFRFVCSCQIILEHRLMTLLTLSKNEKPYFVKKGKTITDYSTCNWVFNRCCLINIPCEPGQIIEEKAIGNQSPDFDYDLLIIRTGFECYRHEVMYRKLTPIFHKDLGTYLQSNFQHLNAIVFDFISLFSSLLFLDDGDGDQVTVEANCD